VIIDKKYSEILGAHMIGTNVTEMIAEIVAARKAEATGHTILKTIQPPTLLLSEGFMGSVAGCFNGRRWITFW